MVGHVPPGCAVVHVVRTEDGRAGRHDHLVLCNQRPLQAGDRAVHELVTLHNVWVALAAVTVSRTCVNTALKR